MARMLAEQRKEEQKNAGSGLKKVSLEDLFAQIQEGELKELPIIVKADVQGSAEAVKTSLEKLTNDEVRVKVIHSAVGAINESDVMLATTSGAIIVGFNVRPDAAAKDSAARNHVDMRMYRVIYDCINEIEDAMKGMLAPKFRENVIGHAEVRETYKVSKVGTVCGCYVQDGKIQRGCSVRVLRDNVVVHEGELASLRRFKDDVREVASGYECGMQVEKFNDVKIGDVIECFVMEEIKV
ncbi:MAG: translation initiation factor IF-2, partial [Oscillospiraceae bacterium]|nr:translation initiation factor IF-2 [Oscillospiraceae bacterium]